MSDRVAVIGAGTIGLSWARLFLDHGLDVVAYDPAVPPGTHDQVEFAADVAGAVTGATFVQESGPERIELKRVLNAQIEAAVTASTIIASSTSGLLISDIQSGTVHPERFVVGHPYNPPHLMPLVEVVGGSLTSEATVDAAMAFYAMLGRRPIRVRRELRGHIANRLQAAVWREAFSLVATGAISVSDLDIAMSNGPGLRWALLGVFLNLEASGGAAGIAHTLDHLGPAIRDWADDLAAFPDDDDYVRPVIAGVADELAGKDMARILASRDELLTMLIAAKKDTGLS
ncbi:MAG: 3-hydroxyacyl-CoA dehydrogenase NAD-binding domain-containing protein [Actinomycetota bacterium]